MKRAIVIVYGAGILASCSAGREAVCEREG